MKPGDRVQLIKEDESTVVYGLKKGDKGMIRNFPSNNGIKLLDIPVVIFDNDSEEHKKCAHPIPIKFLKKDKTKGLPIYRFW